MNQVVEPGNQSFLMWSLQTVGLNGILVFLAAVATFVLALRVSRSAGMNAGSALLLILPFPLLLSVFLNLKGMVASFSVIATSNVELKASEVAGGIAETLLIFIEALMLSFPSYIIAVVFLVQRSLKSESQGGGQAVIRTSI